MKFLSSERGTVTIIFALIFVVLLGITGLVVDIGILYLQKEKIQNALDAACLAGCQDLPDSTKAYNTAIQYAALNGLNSSEVTVQISNNKVSATSTRNVQLYFMPLFGFKSQNVYASSAASGVMAHCFDYTLFSGSKTKNMSTDNTNDITINGTSHTNKDFIITGVNYNFTQACEAVGKVSVSGTNVKVPYRYPNSPYVDMPDYTSQVIQQAQTAGKVYKSSQTFKNTVNVSNSVYIKGNATLSGTNIHGSGAILTTGNITIEGNNTYYSTDDQVCFYSGGNITICGSNITIYGIMYAPKGEIDFQGNNITIYGKVIADNVYFQGDNITINGTNCNVTSLPKSRYKLVQ